MPGHSPLRALTPYRLPALLLGGLALAIGLGVWLGLPGGLLTAAAVALTLVVALAWQSLQHLSGEADLTFEEALSLAAPTTEEEQKRAVLRALKDLEYERSVGKISEEDFTELSARYRAEAKRLILAVDDTLEERRRSAERLLEQRLRPPVSTSRPRKNRKKTKSNEPTHPPSDEGEDGAEQPADDSRPVEASAEEKTS